MSNWNMIPLFQQVSSDHSFYTRLIFLLFLLLSLLFALTWFKCHNLIWCLWRMTVSRSLFHFWRHSFSTLTRNSQIYSHFSYIMPKIEISCFLTNTHTQTHNHHHHHATLTPTSTRTPTHIGYWFTHRGDRRCNVGLRQTWRLLFIDTIDCNELAGERHESRKETDTKVRNKIWQPNTWLIIRINHVAYI